MKPKLTSLRAHHRCISSNKHVLIRSTLYTLNFTLTNSLNLLRYGWIYSTTARSNHAQHNLYISLLSQTGCNKDKLSMSTPCSFSNEALTVRPELAKWAQNATCTAFYQHGAARMNRNSQPVYSAQIVSANSHYWWLREDEYSAFPRLSSAHTSLSLSLRVSGKSAFQFSLSWCHDFQRQTKKSFDRHSLFLNSHNTLPISNTIILKI